MINPSILMTNPLLRITISNHSFRSNLHLLKNPNHPLLDKIHILLIVSLSLLLSTMRITNLTKIIIGNLKNQYELKIL